MTLNLPFKFRLTINRRRPATRATSQPQAQPEEHASPIFWDAFSDGSSIVATCQCGRTHFPTRTDFDYENGELEALLNLADKQPDLYIADNNNGAIGIIECFGPLLVWKCPCKMDARYEALFQRCEIRILDYYRRRLAADTCNVQTRSAMIERTGEDIQSQL